MQQLQILTKFYFPRLEKQELAEDKHYGNKKIHQDFSVCKVMDYSLVNLDAEYSFIGKTDEEKSLVCITSDVPPNVIQRDDGWKGFRIQGMMNAI